MDWKEALSKLGSELSESSEESVKLPGKEEAIKQKGALHVVVEKKGRGGKTATIVEGFDIPDEDVADIARDLRKKLGTGGSSRGGEILIQGDRREAVAGFLRSLGYRVNA
ncbi:MAG: translation initiation factor [Muribaculaceae bacterium]|nr:translation initiation factor [Muribaculaceae bacterium]